MIFRHAWPLSLINILANETCNFSTDMFKTKMYKIFITNIQQRP